MEDYTEVFAWGGDHFGQLGLGDKRGGKTFALPRCCSFNIIIREVACGDEHTAFIANNGYVYAMGNNADGRLGLGNRQIRSCTSPSLVESLIAYNIVKISCGWGHTVAVADNGEAFSWGVGEFGALGNGRVDVQWQPGLVKLPRDVKAVSVSCGSRHTAIITEDMLKRRMAYMCGAGEAGQLGTGYRQRQLAPVVVNLHEETAMAACGVYHTLFLTTTGKILATGGNSQGQLGNGGKKSTSSPVRVYGLDGIYITKIAAGEHSAALGESGEVYIWGTGVFGEFITPCRLNAFPQPVTDISLGGAFGAAVDQGQYIWVWGENGNGELGQGDFEPRAHPVKVSALRDKQVRFLACGGGYIIALGRNIVSERQSITKSSPRVAQSRHASSQRSRRSPKSTRRLDNPIMENIDLLQHFTPIKTHQGILRSTSTQNARNRAHTTRKMQEGGIDRLRDEVKGLQEQLEEEKARYREIVEELGVMRQERVNYQQEVQQAQDQYYEERNRHRQTQQDLQLISGKVQRMEDVITEFKEKEARMEREIEVLQREAADKDRELRTKTMELQQMQEKFSGALSENQTLQSIMERHKRQSSDAELYKDKYQELQYKIQQLEDNRMSDRDNIQGLTGLAHEWEERYQLLANDNKELQTYVTELEQKNKELLYNLEKELAARAREYKDRTLNVLNTPNRQSLSPHRASTHNSIYQKTPSGDFSNYDAQQSPMKFMSVLQDEENFEMPQEHARTQPTQVHYTEPQSKTARSPARPKLSPGSISPFRRDSPVKVGYIRNSPSALPKFSPGKVSFNRTPPHGSNIYDIKAKLAAIKKTKTDLELRMSDFEKRLDTQESVYEQLQLNCQYSNPSHFHSTKQPHPQ